MRIGVPREIKPDEHRVGLSPAAVRELVAHGHEVVVQAGAGEGSGFPDAAYTASGARLAADAEDVFRGAQLIVKVKEPQAVEWARLTADHILFTYLHLAPDPAQAAGLQASGCAAIAYETVTDAQGGLPLLCSTDASKTPSESHIARTSCSIAGRSICAGTARYMGLPSSVGMPEPARHEESHENQRIPPRRQKT